jgi:hypothetical protein
MVQHFHDTHPGRLSTGATIQRVISTIIPVRDKAGFVELCIGSVIQASFTRTDCEVIIVENGSTDGTAAAIDRLLADRVSVIHSTANTVAMARNQGAKAARGTILCFLDADVLVPTDFFDRVEQVFRMPIAAAGCTVALPETSWITRTWGQLHDRGVANLTTLINSADCCVRAEPFREVGGFDQSLVTGEDADLCLRLIEAGHHLLETPALQVLHLDNPETLGEFARKEVWHGLGAGATVRSDRLDRPFVMTLAHGLLVALGILALALGGFSVGGWIVALAAWFAVPLVTVQYRRVLARQPPPFGPSLLLYQVYFLARLWALLLALAGRSRSS